MEKQKEFYYDKDFILKIMEQAKDEQTGLQDYKLCYVSNASDVNFVKRQISNAITLAIYKKDIKTEKVSISKIFRYNGKSYLFYFINKGTLDLLYENNTISNDIASFNSQLEYNIATGGFHTMQQKSKKINDNFLKMVNHTVYINHDEKICPLNEVLLASGELKGDEASRKTFLDCFINARKECSKYANLVRKMDGNKFTIYLEMKPEFVKNWTEMENRPIFKEYIKSFINNVRLNLDQINNACEKYELLNYDGSVKGQLTEDKKSFISKNNKSSYCLIGSSNFNSDYLHDDFERSANFGNAYPVKDLLFLPSAKQCEMLYKLCEDRVNKIEQGQSVENDKEFFEKLKVYDSSLQLYEIEEVKTGTKLADIKKGEIGNYAEQIFYSGDGQRVTIYNKQKELRKKMNYRDVLQNNKLVSMSNAWELGFNNDEFKMMCRAFGNFGQMLYLRYYYLKFTQYLLDVYKSSGALVDLTFMSKLFLITKDELNLINNAFLATDEEKEFALTLLKDANLNSFIAILQRFDGIINVKNYSKVGDKKVLLSNSFERSVEREIKDRIGDIITNWNMVEDSNSFEKCGYAFGKSSLFGKTERIFTLKKILDKSNTTKKKNQQLSANSSNDSPEVL